MNLVEPVTAFREMSPEVPEELLAQLETRDLPPAFADDQNPVTQLLCRYWKIRNVNRTDVAKALTPGTTLNKTFRRIDSILSGESQPSTWVANLMHNLNIPLDEIAAAHRESETWKEQRKLAEFRRNRHRAFRRLGPYLASIDTPSPFSVPAYEDFSFYHLYSVLDNPPLTEVREWISEQPTHLRDGSHITAYLYHRLPEEIHFLDSDGNATERCL